MFSRIFNSLGTAIKFALVAMIFFGAVAFFGAKTFFGLTIITAGAVATVLMWSAISGAIGFVIRFFAPRPRALIEAPELRREPGQADLKKGLAALDRFLNSGRKTAAKKTSVKKPAVKRATGRKTASA